MKTILKITVITFLILYILITWGYLVGLNLLLKSDFVQNGLRDFVKKEYNLDLEIKNPELKTYLKNNIDFKIDELLLKNGDEKLVELSNFDTSVSFLLKGKINIKKLKADSLIIHLDRLLEIAQIPQSDNNENPFDAFVIDFYKGNIGLDELDLSYIQNKTLIQLYMRDIALFCEQNTKMLGFNLDMYVSKGKKTYFEIVSSTLDEITILEDHINVSSLRVLVNNSRLNLDGIVDTKDVILIAKSDVFYLKDIFNLVNCDLIIPDGEALMRPLKDPKGSVDFEIKSNNGDLSGFININNTSAKLIDVSDIPLKMSKGKLIITKDKIDFIGLEGFWGKSKKNKITIKGDIKDYYKSFDSNITIDTYINNEFFKDYLAPLINNTVLYVSKPMDTRIIYKAKNFIMDIVWLARVDKGVNFGFDTNRNDLSDYERVVKGDFHIEGDLVDIKNINYYMTPDKRNRHSMPEPIFVLNAKMNLLGELKNIGFSFYKETPITILNTFLSQQIFKKGTIKGSANVDFKSKTPRLIADMKMDRVIMPEQRLFIKEATLKTDKNNILVNSKGGFKRIRYDLKAKVKNSLNAPYIIKNLELALDNIDVEKFMASVNGEQAKEVQTTAEGIKDDNYMFDTSLIRIEDAQFSLKSGKYKDLTFGNIKANMSLDDKGILRIKSNRFDIAEGHSGLKVECDLKNIKYHLILGIKDVNSDLMAKVLLNLPKEISGKASGLIDITTDETMQMNGTIKFFIKEGTIGKIGLVEYILKIASVFRNPIAMINPAILMDIISVPEGKFDKITGDMKIKNNFVHSINIKSYSPTLSALIKGVYDLNHCDTSLRIYTRFSNNKNSPFNFLRYISLNALANKVQMNTRNDANYYSAELEELPQIEVPENKTQVFLTTVEGDVEKNNFISSLKKIK